MSLPTNFKTINISGDSNESQASGTTSTQVSICMYAIIELLYTAKITGDKES